MSNMSEKVKFGKEPEKYNMEYVKHKRYVIEIKDEVSGRIFYSKRLCYMSAAQQLKGHYNKIAGYFATCFDTKTGEFN